MAVVGDPVADAAAVDVPFDVDSSLAAVAAFETVDSLVAAAAGDDLLGAAAGVAAAAAAVEEGKPLKIAYCRELELLLLQPFQQAQLLLLMFLLRSC